MNSWPIIVFAYQLVYIILSKMLSQKTIMMIASQLEVNNFKDVKKALIV